MKCKVLITNVRPNSYVGKKGLVSETIITCLDQDKFEGQKMLETFDYVLAPEELVAYPGDSLDGKVVEIGVSELKPWNGRNRARGKLPVPVKKA